MKIEAPGSPEAFRHAGSVVREDLNYICAHLKDELEEMAGQHVLLTGGAGFLGYYLVQTLLHWNATASPSQQVALTLLDNFARGVPDWLDQFTEDANLTILTHDITKPLPEQIPPVDYVLHAASIASPTYYRLHPIDTMDANVNGLRLLLDHCLKQKEEGHPVKGFLFFSSSEIYGDPDPAHIPTPETYWGHVSCTGPRACYDESKRYGETLCVNFAQVHGVPVKTVRPFNNYGPGLKITDTRVIPDFARDILEGSSIVMRSDGSPTRTYCYVADAIVGYYKALVRGRVGEAYNIGVEGPEISVLSLADRIVTLARELFDYQGEVVQQVSTDPHYLTDNPNRRCPIIEKARTDLGYEPGIALEEGLRRSLLWYAAHNKAEAL